MGGVFTKDYFEKLLNNSGNSTENSGRQQQQQNEVEGATPASDLPGDPRSPTDGIVRTPLAFHSPVLDPRPPTMGITRTPLYGEPVEAVSDNDEEPVVCPEKLLSDPRSPSSGFERTPILANCEVHQNWENTNDSMIVNASSIQPDTFDLDDSDEEKADRGSLENLFSDSQEELLPINGSTSDIGNVSPINSPSKEQITPHGRDSAPQLTTPRSSTPQKSHRKLTIRDQNSPLSIVQRKQSAKLEKCLNSKSKAPKGFTVAQDKENVA